MINISVCIITKNEREKLERCLKSLLPYDFEIVILDTGSLDGTPEMAKKYTSFVYSFEWINDFAAARNECISHATNDMVFMIDSDEYILKFGKEKLIEKIENNYEAVGRIERINNYSESDEKRSVIDKTNRIFNKNYYRYVGKIHEQIVRKDDEKNVYDTYMSGIIVMHDGYDGTKEERQIKAMRNARLLLEEEKNKPDDPYILFQLAKSFYMATDYVKASIYFEKALKLDVNPKLEYVVDMVTSYGYTLINLERYKDALTLEGVFDEFGVYSDFCFMMGLVYMNNGLFQNAVESFRLARNRKNAMAVGADTFLSWYNEGVIYEVTGNKDEAIKCYINSGEYSKAKKRLEFLS